jgi:Mlc titration factor MtfA (ptsG expression regulator)
MEHIPGEVYSRGRSPLRRWHTAGVPWPRRNKQRVAADAVADAVQRNVALAHRLSPDDHARLLELTAELIDGISWEGVGIEVTDEIKATIAANAVFPVLAHDIYPYRTVRAVIVRPRATRSRGLRSGPAPGTVTDRPMVVDGEATARSGPLALSWDSVVYDSRHPQRGRNVVIHEFAHKIDMLDGDADGVPPLRGDELARWVQTIEDEWDREFGDEQDDALDPYAFSNHAEFFAVATETFFCLPGELAASRPLLYAALRDLYGQDPAARG